jgi:hypothetical protein
MQFYSSNSLIPIGLPQRTVNGNFNSDGTNYGGSGVLNADKIVIECLDGRDYSVALVLPPLGVVVLKLHKSRRLFLLTKQWFSSQMKTL